MQVQGRLGRLIRKGVERKGISVAQLAERAGLSTSGTYKVIAGEGGMPVESTLRSIAKVIGVQVEVLWDAAQWDHRPVDDVWGDWACKVQALAESVPLAERPKLRERLLAFAEIEAADSSV